MLSAVVCFWLGIPQELAAKVPGEYDVKLVYLYNFTKFIRWPDDTFKNDSEGFELCILGNLPSTDSIAALEEKKTSNRSINIRQIAPSEAAEGCQILFITKSLKYPVVTNKVRNLPDGVLVVGETPGFAKHTGDIGFVIDERNRVRIEVNLDRATQRGISVRAQLLEIARKVYRSEESSL